MIRDECLAWVERLERERGWGPAYGLSSSSAHTTVMASCFVVLVYELFGHLSDLSRSRLETWRSHIASCQDEDSGLFIDPQLRSEDLLIDRLDESYVRRQTTFFALSALDALAGAPSYPLAFLEPYKAQHTLRSWLSGLDWSQPWGESNKVMFVASFLIQSWEQDQDARAGEAVQALLDWLDEHQDPRTGYWGTHQGASLLDAMAGAFHFYFLYLYVGRSFRYVPNIIDHTLSLQHADGLFHPAGGGGACLDLDAVDILVKCSLLTDHRAGDVRAALSRAHAALLAAQNEDGGFSEARNRPRPTKSWKRRIGEAFALDRLLNRPYEPPRQVLHYSGWSRMAFGLRESNLWATWFRPLALALISTRYPGEFSHGEGWTFRRGPALGWHDRQRILECRS